MVKSMKDKKEGNYQENLKPADDGDHAAELERQITELKDKYLRAMAELENTRKRAGADIESGARSRAAGVAGHFLPLIDAIDAAAEHSPEDEGIRTLKKAADNTLAKLGIIRIESVGKMLNPQFHNAILTEESDAPANTIVKELQAGFMFGDAVLRSAMVSASKGKEGGESDPQN
jgi:molecular chaperone GrpE